LICPKSVLIGAPRFDSKLYNGVEESGAVFHCQWKPTDSVKNVNCTEINVGKGLFYKIDQISQFLIDFKKD